MGRAQALRRKIKSKQRDLRTGCLGQRACQKALDKIDALRDELRQIEDNNSTSR